MNNEIEFLKEHCEFLTPYDCYILMGVSRKKDNSEMTCSQEVIFREIIRRPDQIQRKYKRLKLNCENYRTDDDESLPFYIYVSNNARDAKKALSNYMSKITNALLEESKGEERSRIFKRLDREFINSLARPSSRSKNRYFLIDFDSPNRQLLHSLLEDLDQLTKDITVKPSRSGFHIKCRPFDKRKLDDKEYYSIEPDRFIFVEYIK